MTLKDSISLSVLNRIMKLKKIRKFNNIIEALDISRFLRKLTAVTVFSLEVTPENKVIRKFSYLGFVCFLFWYLLYFYSAYQASIEDETILRALYNTRVQRYGDDFEGVSSTIFVIFSMWQIPFSLSGNVHFMGIIVNADKALEGWGEKIDYNNDAFSALKLSILQVLLFFSRSLSIWASLNYLGIPIAVHRMFQTTFTDALSLISTTHYCFFLMVLRDRCRYINKILDQIKRHKSWELKIFTRGPIVVNAQKAERLQDRYVCEKLQGCAKIYSTLYTVTEAINKTFGTILARTIFMCVTNMILYMFYFMEATAGGLFHDVPRYVTFLNYVFWHVGYSLVILLAMVYLCDAAVHETAGTSFLTHEILSSDFSPAIKQEALQLSIQLLHQKPIFTAYGLFELNYNFIHQAVRSVFTYLVILLQFVTEQR